jgi:hypothetical protein
MPGPQGRILDEAEFTAIEDRIIAQAPPGLSETDFERWITPRLEQAVAEAEYGPAKVEGSALGRFVSGAAEMLNPVEIVKGVYHAATNPGETIRNVASASADQFGKGVEAVRAGNMSEAAGRFGASFPVVGPMLGAVGDQIGTGDIAGGLGTAAGLAAPFGAAGAVRAARGAVPAGARGRIAAKLEQGARDRVTDVIAPKGSNRINRQMGRDVAQHAGDVTKMLAEEGAPFSREGLRGQVQARRAAAETALDAAAESRVGVRDVPTKPILEALRAKRQALVSEAVEASEVPKGITGAKPAGQSVVPGPNAPRVAVIDQAIREIEALGPSARYEPLRRIRQSYDGPAKARYNPSMTQDYLKVSGESAGAADVTGTLRDTLAKLDPTTAAANAEYHAWRTLDDVLEAAEEQARVRPKVGRQIMSRVVGAMIGGTGGAATAIAGAAVAPSIEAALSGATTKLQAARVMTRLARAVRQGDLGGVEEATSTLRALGTRALKAAPAASAATSPSGRQTLAPAGSPQ